jgi:serine protease inhibitor
MPMQPGPPQHTTRKIPRTIGGILIVMGLVQGATVVALAWLWLNRPTQTLAPAPAIPRDAPAAAGRATRSRPAAASIVLPETERRIMEALAKPFPATQNTPEKLTFREACQRIAKYLPVPIDFDSKALENASIDLGYEVELPNDQRTVGGVLDAVLSSAPAPLDWIVLHDSLTITTEEAAVENPETRVYDVSDLAEPVVTPEGVEWWDMAPLEEAIRASLPAFVVDDLKLYGLTVNGRALLVVSLCRKSHQALAGVLSGIRRAAESDLPVSNAPGSSAPGSSAPGRRRVVQKPRTAPAPPKTATKAELAALQELSVVPATVSPAVVSSSNAFAFDLYRQLRDKEAGNLTVCPFGLYSALAMLKEGASGEVERQMAHVLHATQSADELRASLQALSNRLAAIHLIPGYESVVRNRAWCEESLPVPQPFAEALRTHYQAEAIGVPFFQRPREAEKSINAWLTAATNGRINEIITADQIVANKIDFAVTNAVLFSGRWEHVFDAKETGKAPFHQDGKTFDVAMMRRQRETCPYAEIDGVQVLKRPYRGGLLSALFLLPAASSGALENLEASLAAEKLNPYRAKLGLSLVNIELPRFEIGSDFRFEPALKALGMPRAFTPTRDFVKLGRPEWKLTFVRQKALIKLNEAGTQGAAATIGGGMFGGPRNEPYLFRADRPFLLLIQEESTGLILFLARITEPERAA